MEKFEIKEINKILCEKDASFKNFIRDNRASLRSANLRLADLMQVDLSNGNAASADLFKANLKFADLRSVELEEANLKGADLRSANLEGANLEGANLKGANLSGANIKNCTIPMYSKHYIGIKASNADIEKQDIRKIKIIIGCKVKTISEWDKWFNSEDEYETKRGTFEFKQIQGMYEAYRAYIVRVWGA